MKPIHIREFINTPEYHSGGHILVDLDREGDGRLVIADCNRAVTICLDNYDQGAHDNTVFKLETLHDAIGRALRAIRRTPPPE